MIWMKLKDRTSLQPIFASIKFPALHFHWYYFFRFVSFSEELTTSCLTDWSVYRVVMIVWSQYYSVCMHRQLAGRVTHVSWRHRGQHRTIYTLYLLVINCSVTPLTLPTVQSKQRDSNQFFVCGMHCDQTVLIVGDWNVWHWEGFHLAQWSHHILWKSGKWLKK